MADDSSDSAEHADSPIQVIAKRTQKLRTGRDWSHARLAEEMTKVGVPWDRQVVTKLENGRRQAFSIVELYALAHVFDIPPIRLLLPIGTGDQVEVLPGLQVDEWTAARWLMGDEHYAEYDPDGVLIGDPERWHVATAPIKLRRRYDRLIAEYDWVITETQMSGPPEDDRVRARRQAKAENLLRELRSLRAQMRQHPDMKAPELPEHLQHIDDRRYVWMTPEEAATRNAEHPGEWRPVDYSHRMPDAEGGDDAG